MPDNVLMGQLHLSKACWELWLSDYQPHSDYNGQWQRALCILAVLQSSQQTHRGMKKNRKMYAIKQIKICAEYRDMLPRPRLDLSGTPGLRPIGLSPGSWQTSLGLGSMSRYSAQILICIVIPPATKLGGVYWIQPVCLSVCPSVRLSVCPLTFSCPPCSIYSSGWILSIFGTNDQ